MGKNKNVDDYKAARRELDRTQEKGSGASKTDNARAQHKVAAAEKNVPWYRR